MLFDIANEVTSLGVQGVYLKVTGLKNRQRDDNFDDYANLIIKEKLSDFSYQKLESDPILRGFHDLHNLVGRKGKKNTSSPENLLSILLQTGKMPKVNLLVDIYNIVSIQTHLALGAHDTTFIEGDVHLRLTNGNEKFWPLGYSKPKVVEAGEYAYIDDADDIICRLEVRQVEKTKVSLDSHECFYIIQGNKLTDINHLKYGMEYLLSLTKEYCGGKEEILYAPW